ncbi:hypothetical protein C1G87_0625 [Dehalococcoides mccartyi]|uniref:Uncharacterized protein n=1 Tax=Dehalococcoides mccartyi TaxID=61435 RepID=A0A142V9U5_9CHLR|nr:hypothetical protein X794_02675 [Dehalococcoides mccartyi CG5]AMU86419.1 hypothetical protein Dm11a5_0593 [Dehalococcoides mccartyi]AOV99248.1 hypothetical protein DCWBC2_0587 [Dehalococcoides mccartyi]MBA2085029.1 hypothetical protein [Dehalococcoides mccartyi]RAL69597.1 hypothetical protein C1G87_0625 [Dehalococcoides mccartyi]
MVKGPAHLEDILRCASPFFIWAGARGGQTEHSLKCKTGYILTQFIYKGVLKIWNY